MGYAGAGASKQSPDDPFWETLSHRLRQTNIYTVPHIRCVIRRMRETLSHRLRQTNIHTVPHVRCVIRRMSILDTVLVRITTILTSP